MIRFFIDHDVPDEVERLLRHWNYDTRRLRDVLPIEISDAEAFGYAQRESRIIITCNRSHFLTLARDAFANDRSFAGLIILIRRSTRQAECAHLLSLLRKTGEDGIRGNINLA